MFETFGERHRWIEGLYDRQEYTAVVLECGKLTEELMARLIGRFHATLNTPEERRALLDFEEQHAAVIERFLAGPTIGVSIGLYNALLARFQPHPWLEPSARRLLNALNDLRNRQAHAGALQASDDDASDAMDRLEDLLDLLGLRDLERTETGVPLAYFLVYRSLHALFDQAGQAHDFEAIVSDARKLLPPLLEALLRKLYPRLDRPQKELLLAEEGGSRGLEEHAAILARLVHPLEIPEGDDLLQKLKQIAAGSQGLSRRVTKSHVRALDIVVQALLQGVNPDELEYADQVKKRYLVGGRIDLLARAQLETIAVFHGIAPLRAERIEAEVIRVIDAALVPYRTLVRTAAAPDPTLDASDAIAVPADAAPRSLPPVRHNLPPRPGAWIDPDDCLDRLLAALHAAGDGGWLIGVVGFAGVGKSRLVLEAATRCVENHSFEAVIWLSGQRTQLTSAGIRSRRDAIGSIEQLLDELAFAIDLSDIAKLPTLRLKSQAIARFLGTTRCLLVVDGIDEMDTDEMIEQLGAFVRPGKVIVTSRRDPGSLDISFTVPCPSREPSLALMRAECKRKGLREVDDATLQSLYEATGGLPLAMIWSLGLLLELPAARVLRLVRAATGDLLRYCFGNSLAELSPEARFTLGLAAVFLEPPSYDALSAIAARLGRPDDLDPGIQQLLRLSLIRRERRYRYTMLPLTVDLVPALLESEPGMGERLAAAFADHFRQQASRWRTQGREGLAEIGAQRCNLRRALDWLGHQQDAERRLAFSELIIDLHEYLWLHGHWNDLVRYHELAWEIGATHGRWDLAGQHAYTVGFTVFQQGRFEEAARWGERATEAMGHTGDAYHMTRVMRLPAMIARIQGDLATSRALQHHMIDTARTLLDGCLDERERRAIRSDILVDALTSLGNLERDLVHDYHRARELYTESLRENREMDNREKIGLNLNHLGRADLLEYDEVIGRDPGRAAALLESAERHFAEGRQVSEAVPRADQILIGLWGMARVAVERGEPATARELATRALAEYGHSGAVEVTDIERLLAGL